MVTKGHQAQMTLIMILFNNNFKISCKQLIFSFNKVILLKLIKARYQESKVLQLLMLLMLLKVIFILFSLENQMMKLIKSQL